jgi:hypothetical protein
VRVNAAGDARRQARAQELIDAPATAAEHEADQVTAISPAARP